MLWLPNLFDFNGISFGFKLIFCIGTEYMRVKIGGFPLEPKKICPFRVKYSVTAFKINVKK